jgi:hypothetical protein
MAAFDYNQFIMPGVGAGLNLLGATPGLINAIQQGKERRRLLAEGPEGLNQYEQAQLNAAQARAASSQVPGYGQEIENINQQQANILGEAKRAGISSSNMLNALSRLNQQGQAARRNLAIRGAQTQRAAQSELGGIQGAAGATMQNRKRYWEKNLADLDTARRQQIAQFAMSPVQGALAFMPVQGLKFGTGAGGTSPTNTTNTDLTQNAPSLGYRPKSYGNIYGAKDRGYESTLPFPDLY